MNYLILRVHNEVKTLDNTKGAIKIYIPEKLGTLGPQDRKKNKTQYVLDTTLHKIKTRMVLQKRVVHTKFDIYFFFYIYKNILQFLINAIYLYTYEFLLSLCKIVRSSVILLLPLFTTPGSS